MSRSAGLGASGDERNIDDSDLFKKLMPHNGQAERSHTSRSPSESSTDKVKSRAVAVDADTTLDKSKSLDEISLINEASLDLLIAGDNSDWQVFSPFKNILLGDHPISAQSFEALLREHGHEIGVLEIGNCPNIKSLPNELRTILNNLVDLKINHSPYAGEFLQSITLQLPKLEKLALHGYDFKDSFIENAEFSSLSSLTLQDSLVSGDKLGAILQKCRVIKRLEIHQCFNIGSQHIDNLKLTSLETLVIKSSNISLESIQALFKSAPNLKRIHMSHCYKLDAGDLVKLKFKNLEELYIRNCNFTDKSIEALRNSAKADAKITIIKPPVQEKVLQPIQAPANKNKKREDGIKIASDDLEGDHFHPMKKLYPLN